jgi:hypothetical protein
MKLTKDTVTMLFISTIFIEKKNATINMTKLWIITGTAEETAGSFELNFEQ